MASLKVDQHNQHLLAQHFSTLGVQREMERMASVGLPHARDWLNVVPSPSIGLHLRTLEFAPVVKYILGIKLYSKPGPYPACSHSIDEWGDQAIGCGTQGERIVRHNYLRDALYQTAASAALAPTREGRFLLPGSSRRPADVLVLH